jgi:hypothetical protein
MLYPREFLDTYFNNNNDFDPAYEDLDLPF